MFAWIVLCRYFKASVHSQGLHYHKFCPCLHLFTHFFIREEINNFRNWLDSVHVLIILYICICKKIKKTGHGSCHYKQNQWTLRHENITFTWRKKEFLSFTCPYNTIKLNCFERGKIEKCSSCNWCSGPGGLHMLCNCQFQFSFSTHQKSLQCLLLCHSTGYWVHKMVSEIH